MKSRGSPLATLSKTLCPSQIQEASCLGHILGHLLPELGKTVSMNLPSAHMLGSSVFTLVEYLLDDEGFRFLRVVSVPENALNEGCGSSAVCDKSFSTRRNLG